VTQESTEQKTGLWSLQPTITHELFPSGSKNNHQAAIFRLVHMFAIGQLLCK